MIKIGLGTAQLGLPYGNQSHLPLMSKADATAILTEALKQQIRIFDTAVAYGESETRIGEFNLASRSEGVEIISKIPRGEGNYWEDAEGLFRYCTAHIEGSCRRLKVASLPLWFLHEHRREVLAHPNWTKVLSRLVAAEWAEGFGVSVYTPEEATFATQLPHVRAIQVPANLLDVRCLSDELVNQYRAQQIRVICRSVFLQGLLHPSAALPQVARIGELTEIKHKVQELCAAHGSEPALASLSFLVHEYGHVIDTLLLGAESATHLHQSLALVHAATNAPLTPVFKAELALLRTQAGVAKWVDPRIWNS